MALTDNLAFWLDFEDDWTDAHDNGLDFTAVNSPTFIDSGFAGDRAGKFVPVSQQHLSRAHDAALSVDGSSWTLGFWYRAPTTPTLNRYIAGKNGAYYVFLRNSDGKLSIRYWVGGGGGFDTWTVTGMSSIADQAWHSVLIWVENGDTSAHIHARIDGGADLDRGFPIGSAQDDPGNILYWNASTTGTLWVDGEYTSAALWQRALTDAERTEFHNSGTPLTYNDIAPAVWPDVAARENQPALSVITDSAHATTLTASEHTSVITASLHTTEVREIWA